MDVSVRDVMGGAGLPIQVEARLQFFATRVVSGLVVQLRKKAGKRIVEQGYRGLPGWNRYRAHRLPALVC